MEGVIKNLLHTSPILILLNLFAIGALVAIFVVKYVKHTSSQEAIYDLTDSQLAGLEKRALVEGDADAAWRVNNYYVFTKHQQSGEGLRWQHIAENLDAKAKARKASASNSRQSY